MLVMLVMFVMLVTLVMVVMVHRIRWKDQAKGGWMNLLVKKESNQKFNFENKKIFE